MKSNFYKISFVEIANTFGLDVINFYHYIATLLIVVILILSYWLIQTVNLFFFKKQPFLILIRQEYISKKKIFSLYNNSSLQLKRYSILSDISDYPFLEALWVFVPLSFVAIVAYPSVGLEYGISPDVEPLVILKVLANQWYWSVNLKTYAHPGLMEGFNIIEEESLFNESDLFNLFKVNKFQNSYNFFSMIDFSTLERSYDVNFINDDINFFRMVAVDNPIVLPLNTPIKVIVTSNDVLHAFALPSLSIKIDAVPGRLSEQTFIIERPGLFWGQCSELCGPYHGYMPIIVEGTTLFNYIFNMKEFSNELLNSFDNIFFFSQEKIEINSSIKNNATLKKNPFMQEEFYINYEKYLNNENFDKSFCKEIILMDSYYQLQGDEDKLNDLVLDPSVLDACYKK